MSFLSTFFSSNKEQENECASCCGRFFFLFSQKLPFLFPHCSPSSIPYIPKLVNMGGRSSGTTTTSKKKKSDNENSKSGGREIPFALSSRITLGKRPSLQKKQNTEKFENALHSVLVRDDVLSPKECATIAEVCSTRYRLATSRGPKFGEAWRKNNRLSFVDEKLAKMLWEDVGLKTMFSTASDDDTYNEKGGGGEQFHSLNENFRVYEYTQSHHFGPHIDERVRKTSNRGEKLVSTHTMLLY